MMPNPKRDPGHYQSNTETAFMSQTKTEAQPAPTSSPKIIWDDSKMQTSYSNVVNGTSTREEVSVFFGTNQTWNVQDRENIKEVTVELTNRIVLNPFAAKRLLIVLNRIVDEYEKRFGTLDLELPTAR